MPVVALPVQLLDKHIGEPPLGAERLVELLRRLGCDVEGHERARRYRCGRCAGTIDASASGGPPSSCELCGHELGPGEQPEPAGEVDVVRIDLLPVRPDMLDAGGLARALRAFTGRSDGLVSYPTAPPTLRVAVDPAMASRESYRPYIACAVVRGVAVDADMIRVIMKMQENLHWAMGRDRKLASIGVYDLATIEGPTLRYRAVGPEERRFVPLLCDPADPDSNMTPRRVLEAHPKGVAYAHLLAGLSAYPLLEDAKGTVLSMPPIINSEETRVRQGTSDLFIDVTGLSQRLVERTVAVAVTSLVELDAKARIERVEVAYPDRTVTTPTLEPDRFTLDVAAAARLIGIPLGDAEAAQLLRRMGHGAEPEGPGRLAVRVPAYRNDVMHEVDLVEDVAIAYGIERIVPSLVKTLTVGTPRRIDDLAAIARRALCGLGLLEVVSMPLSSPEASFDHLGLERSQPCVTIANPVSVEQTMLRTSLLPGLLGVLKANIHRELPQRIFEVGDTTLLDDEAETGAREQRRAAVALLGPKTGLAEVRSVADALVRELGASLVASPLEGGPDALFIPGRAARLALARSGVEVQAGVMGEVHPRVLESLGLRAPAALFEIDLEPLV